MHRSAPSASNGSGEPPLAVDLDGTLIGTDSLFEGVLQVLKRNPVLLVMLPVWLLRGKAALKREVADRVELDVEFLPYNAALVGRLRAERPNRTLVLCTAADHRFAAAVAKHLDLFHDVMATRDNVNLSSGNKAEALVTRYGAQGFDYAGNAAADLRVFQEARRSVVINPTFGLRRRLGRITNLEPVQQSRPGFSLKPYLQALRPHQWVKNILIFVVLLATFDGSHFDTILPAVLGFVSFCLVASAGYLLNDLIDLGADRRHPRKRERPLAAGTVPLSHALIMIPALIVGGVLVALQVSVLFLGTLVLYGLGTTLYTFWFKRVPLLDTLLLSGLYTLRILAGAAAVVEEPSFWLLSFSMFFFLSLALAKRHSELRELEGPERAAAIPGREYRAEDLSTLISQGAASGYAAVLVLALYIDSSSVREHYRHPKIIWLICPLVLYWINKLWLNSQRRQIKEDPVVWAFQNRVSRVIAVLSVGLLLLARFLP
ncbi:MAG: UbiA family prenyltransferase [Gemmatimonadota bacterium]